MVNENELDNLIKYFVEKYNINSGDYAGLRSKVQEQLAQVESYIQSFVQEQKTLALQIKNNRLNIASVTKEAGLQRSTVYNNADTLKRYIEERIREVEEEDILSIHRTAKQQEEMEFLRSYLEKLQLRMAKEERDAIVIRELESEYSKLNNVNVDLYRQIHELKQKNEELQQQLRKIRRGDVVPLDMKMK